MITCGHIFLEENLIRSTMLSNVKVLDLTRVLAGPYCTMLMADLGANVYKIERPDGGDETRAWGPPFHSNGESCYYLSINRNKKSVAVNFKKPEGVEIIRQLAKKCDVFVENYLPGHLKKIGLDYETMKSVNPKLVYCSLTGYGQKGSLARKPGYDVVIASVGGLNGITGPKDGDPCRIGVALTDISTGLYAYGSILAALLSRATTGRGTHIDANLLSTQTAVLSHIAANWLNCGVNGSRWGTAHPSIVPYQAFKTSDNRQMVVGAGNDASFKILCDTLGITDVASDPRFSSNASRVKHRQELISILEKIFVKQSSEYWETVFDKVPLPFGKINSISEAMQLVSENNPESVLEICNNKNEKLSVTGPAVKFNSPDFAVKEHTFPPRLGGDTFSVIENELAYTKDRLVSLEKSGVILQA